MFSSLQRLSIHSQWTLFVVLAYGVALFGAWQLLARVDFLYPLWYDVIRIEQTIAIYGPQNRHRARFETTSKAERLRLFSAIVAAIHRQGKGLETLVYQDSDGRPIASLLTPPEIIHLQDVSRLLDRLPAGGWGAMVGGSMLLGLLRMQQRPMPSVKRLLLTAVMAAGGVGGLIVLLGPVNVFYTLHTWVFPAGHAWFFYYQDSLMTTLMKAPDIFACIALSLVALSLLLLMGILFVSKKLYERI
jgi:hypothetical protein